jgi:hypothetical protein
MISADRARLAFVALIRTAFPWVYAGRFGSLSIDLFRTLLAAAAVAVAWRALRSIRTPSGPAGKEAPCLERTLEFGGCLIAATLTLVVWYTLSSWATHFYSRYFAPIALVSALVGGVLVASWVQRRPRLAPVIAGALAMPVLFVACSACAGWYQDIGFVVRQFKLVQEYVPAEEWVAAGQTGTLAYFRDRTLNLDGKVNGAALAYQNNMWVYLEERNVRWFCDWPRYTTQYLGPDPSAHGWALVASEGDFRLYRRGGPEPKETSRKPAVSGSLLTAPGS